MKYEAGQMEEQAILETAAKMCAAARTAPKAKGLDRIVTLVLTGAEKDALADKMHEVANREFGDTPSTFHRDAENLRAAAAVVLLIAHSAVLQAVRRAAKREAGAASTELISVSHWVPL